jgi:hypothetical protein
MADIVIPSQMRYIDPYQQRIYNFNSTDSRVYLSRHVDSVLKVIGNDIIVGGLKPTLLTCDSSNNITVTISPGIAIQDLTVVEILEPITLTLNVDSFADTGMLVVYIHWKWINTTEPNLCELRLAYKNADGSQVSNYGWDVNYDRTLVCGIKYTKSMPSNVVTNYYIYDDYNTTIRISGVDYYITNAHNSPLQGLISNMQYILADKGTAPGYIGNKYHLGAVNGNLTLTKI